MIDIKVLASGSKGNCTAVTHGETTILLDAGINLGKLRQALNFENPAAVFITHEHSDHVNKVTLNELLKRSVDVYMTNGTATALNLEPRHNLKLIQSKIMYTIDNEKYYRFYAFPTVHDAAEPVYFGFNFATETVKYLTDTNKLSLFDTLPDYLVIEANHSTDNLLNSNIDAGQKDRIFNSHLAVEKVLKYLQSNQSSRLKEVHLIHISKRHGNPEYFKKLVQDVVGDKVKVFAY